MPALQQGYKTPIQNWGRYQMNYKMIQDNPKKFEIGLRNISLAVCFFLMKPVLKPGILYNYLLIGIFSDLYRGHRSQKPQRKTYSPFIFDQSWEG